MLRYTLLFIIILSTAYCSEEHHEPAKASSSTEACALSQTSPVEILQHGIRSSFSEGCLHGDTLIALLHSSNSFIQFSLKNAQCTEQPLALLPTKCVSAQNSLFLIYYWANSIMKFNTTTGKIESTTLLPQHPSIPVLSGNFLFLFHDHQRSLCKVNLSTLKVISQRPIGIKASDAVIYHDTLFAASEEDPIIVAINEKTLIKKYQFLLDYAPRALHILNDQLFVLLYEAWEIIRIDLKNLKRLQTIETAGNPVAITSKGDLIFVASEGIDPRGRQIYSLTVFDLKNKTERHFYDFEKDNSDIEEPEKLLIHNNNLLILGKHLYSIQISDLLKRRAHAIRYKEKRRPTPPAKRSNVIRS